MGLPGLEPGLHFSSPLCKSGMLIHLHYRPNHEARFYFHLESSSSAGASEVDRHKPEKLIAPATNSTFYDPLSIERKSRIELPSPAWQAGILAAIRLPHFHKNPKNQIFYSLNIVYPLFLLGFSIEF